MNCKQQHAAWEQEAARVRALAAQLGPQAAACVEQQLAYDKEVARRRGIQKAFEDCQAQTAAWELASVRYQVAQKVQEYRKYVAGVEGMNARRLASWQRDVAAVRADNAKIAQDNEARKQDYFASMRMWSEQNGRHVTWRNATDAQKADIGRQWEATLARNPALKNYRWTAYSTSRCNTTMYCMTAAEKERLRATCQPVRGLGATLQTPSICLRYSYTPTCPTTCPPYASHPGDPPAAPVYAQPKPEPGQPVLTAVKPWGEWSGGMDPSLLNGDTNAPDPGAPPGACKSLTGEEPAKPLCTVPEIPQVPPAPECEVGVFSQIGPMWLLLAAGGAGLYWLTRK
jgi:hypothetical protein